MLPKLAPVAAIAVVALLFAGCGGSSSSGPSTSSGSSASGTTTLTGAGSTFDYPFFTKAFDVYCKKHNVCVNYQAIGSGAGIQQFTAKTVDFGASDVPMDPTELKAAQKAVGPVVELPIALGGVSMAYNLPGIKSGLHLDGPTISQIYLGKITKWNDPVITKLNPGMKLPATHITVAHRSDSSGTSYIFTDYLSHVSSSWKSKVGTGKAPAWPVGVGGKGNPGVAQIVQQTPGAIGYVELAYVLQNHMTQAKVKGKAGSYLFPNQTTVKAAAAQFPHVSASNFSIVDAPGTNSYPIAGYSWVLMAKHMKSASKHKALVALMSWTVTAGQRYAANLDYVPLPTAVRNQATAKLNATTG